MKAIEAAGIAVERVTGAGTGSFVHERNSGVFNEVQAGSYVFMDRDYGDNQRGEGDIAFEHALFVRTTVMSRPTAERAVVDAGLKASSVDSGMPTVWQRPDLRYAKAADEHGALVTPDEAALALGDTLMLVPGHCDPTVNLYDELVCYPRRPGRGPLAHRGARRAAVTPTTIPFDKASDARNIRHPDSQRQHRRRHRRAALSRATSASAATASRASATSGRSAARWRSTWHGRIAAPGFIDAHTHDDRLMLSNPDMAPKVSQGITTVVAGNCGISLAPMPRPMPQPVTPPLNLLDEDGKWFSFPTFAAYIAELKAKPAATNCALLVGPHHLARGDHGRPAGSRRRRSRSSACAAWCAKRWKPAPSACPPACSTSPPSPRRPRK